jgi:hydrogenase expression/formation protein HypC
MCLAVPGKIISIESGDELTRTGKVSFGGTVKDINLAMVPEAGVDDYVLVHVGVAISVIDAEEAAKIFEYLKAMDELADLEDGVN